MIIPGNLYHVKDSFFSKFDDKHLMKNHTGKGKRPIYLASISGEILWLVPLSSKVDKYKKVISSKLIKYGRCDSILIRKILGKETAILLQNAFPCKSEFIDHPHLTSVGKEAKVVSGVRKEIENSLQQMFIMRRNGKNLFLVDINKLLKKLISYQQFKA